MDACPLHQLKAKMSKLSRFHWITFERSSRPCYIFSCFSSTVRSIIVCVVYTAKFFHSNVWIENKEPRESLGKNIEYLFSITTSCIYIHSLFPICPIAMYQWQDFLNPYVFQLTVKMSWSKLSKTFKDHLEMHQAIHFFENFV